MRTTLNLDDDLISALGERLPGRTKTEAIETAIAAYLERDAVERLRAMGGKVEIGDLASERRAAERERSERLGRRWDEDPA